MKQTELFSRRVELAVSSSVYKDSPKITNNRPNKLSVKFVSVSEAFRISSHSFISSSCSWSGQNISVAKSQFSWSFSVFYKVLCIARMFWKFSGSMFDWFFKILQKFFNACIDATCKSSFFLQLGFDVFSCFFSRKNSHFVLKSWTNELKIVQIWHSSPVEYEHSSEP